MQVSGDVTMLFEALRKPVADPQVITAMALFGLPAEKSEYVEGGRTTTYYVAKDDSAEFVFEEGLLDGIIVAAMTTDDHVAYVGADQLIEGIDGESSRDDVRALLGEPESSAPIYDRYKIGSDFVRFRYKDDRVKDITVMASVP